MTTKHLDLDLHPSTRTCSWVRLTGGTILVTMGFNPHRVRQRSVWDYVFVASAFVACAVVLAWAMLG